jgi:hypothetical protein
VRKILKAVFIIGVLVLMGAAAGWGEWIVVAAGALMLLGLWVRERRK